MPGPLLGAGASSLRAFGDALVERAVSEVMVWVPAEVLAFHPPGDVDGAMFPARVDVQIQIKYRRRLATEADLQPGETLCPDTPGAGAEAVGNYPIVRDAPVGWPGVRAFRMRGPVSVGEIGRLHVSGRELARWRQGELGVTPPWMGGTLSGEYSSLQSAVWVPGLEVGPTENATFDNLYRLGDDLGKGSLSYDGAGAWGLDGLSVDVRAPSTSIGALGPGIALAKNAQQLAIWSALVGALNAIPAGPVTDVELAAVATALGTTITAAIGTTSLTAE